MEFDKDELIKYRVKRAKETAEDARIALENDRLHNAENRIYYAIFYIISALALQNDFSTSKHSQLLSWFNRNYVKTGKVNKEIGKIYKKQFENRLEGDYDDFVELNKEDVEVDYKNMLDFISEIEKLFT